MNADRWYRFILKLDCSKNTHWFIF